MKWSRFIPLMLSLAIPAQASVLSDAANTLQPGQSVKLNTTLSGSLVNNVPGAGSGSILSYGGKGVWDPVRNEARYVGKGGGTGTYLFLVYDEATNVWTNNRGVPSGISTTSGHGYDGNAVDPSTGDHYYRPYYGTPRRVYKWTSATRVWSQLPDLNANNGFSCCGSLEWISGQGLFSIDGRGGWLQRFNGSAWANVYDLGTTSTGYHEIGSYESDSGIMVFGGGNSGQAYRRDPNGSINAINGCAFDFSSAAANGVGNVTADPGPGSKFVAFFLETGNWYEYDAAADSCSNQLAARSAANPTVPANGTPPLGAGPGVPNEIDIPIPEYGVILFVQENGSNDGAVWVYRHSGAPSGPPPPPVLQLE